MALSDDELLDFSLNGLHMNVEHIRRALVHQGNVYRSQLVAARWIEGWRDQIKQRGAGEHSPEFLAGFEEALTAVIAYLRQGDLIPGGELYEDEVSGRVRY